MWREIHLLSKWAIENILVCIGGVIHLKKLDRRLGRKFSQHTVLEIVSYRTKLLTTGKNVFYLFLLDLKNQTAQNVRWHWELVKFIKAC